VQTTRGPVLFGVYVIIFFVGIGGIWSAVAPLNKAAVAMGNVISSTNKKVIQYHNPQAIVKDILVKPGDVVQEGDPLVTFDETKSKNQYEISRNMYYTFLTQVDRLRSELNNNPDIKFDEQLLNSQDPEIIKVLQNQRAIFESRRAAHNDQIKMLKSRQKQVKKTIVSAQERLIQNHAILENMIEREKVLEDLIKQEYATKKELLDVRNSVAQARERIAQTEGEIAANKKRLQEAESELSATNSKFINEASRELQQALTDLNKYKEQLETAQYDLDHVVVRSPVTGIINEVHLHTIGSAIGNQPVIEISPIDDNLVIRAYVSPQHIDSVEVGLKSKIRFSAFKSRTTPVFDGTVVSLSPDVVEQRGPDGRSNPVYVALIEIDMAEFTKVAKAKNLVLHPGMGVEVQIVTGTRTLLQYLLDPITDNMFRAFNEK